MIGMGGVGMGLYSLLVLCAMPLARGYTTWSDHYTSNMTISKETGKAHAYFYIYARKDPKAKFAPPVASEGPSHRGPAQAALWSPHQKEMKTGVFVELAIPFTTPAIDYLSFQSFKTNSTAKKDIDVWFTWSKDGSYIGVPLVAEGEATKPRIVQLATNNTGWGMWNLQATTYPLDQPFYIHLEWTMKPIVNSTANCSTRGHYDQDPNVGSGPGVGVYVICGVGLAVLLVIGAIVAYVKIQLDKRAERGPLLPKGLGKIEAVPLPKYTEVVTPPAV